MQKAEIDVCCRSVGQKSADSRCTTVEAHLRHYFEPAPANATTSSTTVGTSASQMVDLEAPLPSGVLTTNLGIPIVIVCTKVSPFPAHATALPDG